jgi:hypothetical protein
MNQSSCRLLVFVFTVIALARVATGVAQQPGDDRSRRAQSPASAELRIIHAEQDKDVIASLKPYIEQGKQKVERFFGERFKKAFEIEVVPSRAAFDEYFRKRWKIPKTEAWMVASGVADRMVILSPRVWKTQAAEHDPADAEHIRDIIAHELVHVYHGQQNPRPDFDGMDDCGWFVEGLAVYVSGQLERSHRTAARDAVKAGKAPIRLADAWSGRYRYGLSGSMVKFADKRYGRKVVKKLLAVVSNEEAMKLLNTTEGEFLEAWKGHVSAQP